MSKTSMPVGLFSKRSDWMDRLVSQWRLKVTLALILTPAFCVPYFLLMYFPLRAFQPVPELAMDRLIRFDPRWVWIYQSLYLPINGLPWLATQREQLRRYALGFLALCAISFLIYAIYPTIGPRPQMSNPSGMYRLLLLYDQPGNAFPSLHAGLLIYTLLFVRRIFGQRRRSIFPWIGWCILILWSLLILYATLATKQHYAIDLLAGAVLAIGADRLAWSKAVRISAVTSGRISQSG
jgi:membrane-associated phospholipid phosphatase